MQNGTHVSIITAAYNIEDYLPVCLDSILAQTFQDFEVLLIDDGSTDSTGLICDKYARKDARIRVLHQENSGVSDTWNAALELVHGEYVGFVDGDDFIHPRMYELLYEAVRKTQSDIAFCEYGRFSGGDEKSAFADWTDYTIRVSSTDEELTRITRPYSAAHIWKGLYKYDCIKQFRFLSGKSCQDRLWSPCVVLNASRIARVDRVLYMYRVRGSSVTHSDIKKSSSDGLYVEGQLLDYLKNNAPKWAPLFTIKLFTDCVTVYNRIQENCDDTVRRQYETNILSALEYCSELRLKDILQESHTKPTRKLLAVAGKLSFPFACAIKRTVLTVYGN